jgi:hypothetical protein
MSIAQLEGWMHRNISHIKPHRETLHLSMTMLAHGNHKAGSGRSGVF